MTVALVQAGLMVSAPPLVVLGEEPAQKLVAAGVDLIVVDLGAGLLVAVGVELREGPA